MGMPRIVPALVAVAGLGVALVVARATSDPEPSPTPVVTASSLPGLPAFGSYTPQAGCIENLPGEIPEPQYRPENLPLPRGTVPIEVRPDPAPGLHIVVYRVPVTLDALATFVLREWPATGWTLGQGEREPAEAESVFYRPDRSRYGHLRARSVYCDRDQTELVLTLGEDTGSVPSPSGGP